MSKDEASAEQVENLRLSQLATFGIVVNPQWSIPNLQPEDLYIIAYESCSKVLNPAASSDATAKKHCTDAVISWLSENFSLDGNNAADTHQQALAELASLPKKLSADAKKKFDACSVLGQIVKAHMGVPEHIDYSAMMYPNEKNSRDLITALLERLSDHQDRIRAIAAGGGDAAENAKRSLQSASRNRADVIAAAFSSLRTSNQRPAAFASPGPRRFMRYSNKTVTSLKKPDQVASTALHNNSLRRLVGVKLGGGSSHGAEDPEWVVAALGDNGAAAGKRKKKAAGDDKNANDLLFGSVADIAPQQAAEAERRAAEMRAKLKSAEDSVAQMKLSVEDAQRAREQEDADLSANLKQLKAGIKLFKAQVRSAKEEMEGLEAQFVELQDAEAEEDAARDAEMAAIAARREVVDGVAGGGADFVSSLDEKLAELREQHNGLIRDIEAKMAKLRKKCQGLRDRIVAMGPSKKEILAQVQTSAKALARECRTKLEEHEQLEAELERCKAKSKLKLDRAVLSRMIYDVTVRRHAKQEEHIVQIIAEIGDQERKKDELTEAISSRYAQIESDMYAAAKTDATVRELFTPLVGLRGEYVNLVKRIEERGRARKESHDVETRLNKLLRFSDASMLSSAEQDLGLVTESIRSVQAEIDKLNSGDGSSPAAAAAAIRPDEEDAI